MTQTGLTTIFIRISLSSNQPPVHQIWIRSINWWTTFLPEVFINHSNPKHSSAGRAYAPSAVGGGGTRFWSTTATAVIIMVSSRSSTSWFAHKPVDDYFWPHDSAELSPGQAGVIKIVNTFQATDVRHSSSRRRRCSPSVRLTNQQQLVSREHMDLRVKPVSGMRKKNQHTKRIGKYGNWFAVFIFAQLTTDQASASARSVRIGEVRVWWPAKKKWLMEFNTNQMPFFLNRGEGVDWRFVVVVMGSRTFLLDWLRRQSRGN